MRDNGAVRFKRARLFLDGCHAALRCWRFAGEAPLPRQDGWEVLATFSSAIRQRPELGDQNQNRIHNMQVACEALNGRVLDPGRVLSLRRLLGEPAEARGYRAGPMLRGQSLGSSVGGGLCQISTNLFNAGLLADLEILERHAHSSDPWGEARAFPLGLDATFVHARLDLKLRNPHLFPVQLCISVAPEGDRLETAFLAPTRLLSEPRIQTRVLERIEPPEAAWMPGWRVETRRTDEAGHTTYCDFSRYAPTRSPGGS